MRWFRTESGLVARQLGREDVQVTDYEEGIWNPSDVALENMSGTGSYSDTNWIRIGNVVHGWIGGISGLSTTTGTTAVSLQITTDGLPGIIPTSSNLGGSGLMQRASEKHAITMTWSSSSNTNIFMGMQSNSSGTISISGIYFSYIFRT